MRLVLVLPRTKYSQCQGHIYSGCHSDGVFRAPLCKSAPRPHGILYIGTGGLGAGVGDDSAQTGGYERDPHTHTHRETHVDGLVPKAAGEPELIPPHRPGCRRGVDRLHLNPS